MINEVPEDETPHFEDMVESLLLEEGPLTSQEIADRLYDSRDMLVVLSPDMVYEEYDDDGLVVRGGETKAISSDAVETRLEKSWTVSKDDSGRWHLSSKHQ